MGIPLIDNFLFTVSFADDQVVIAPDYDDLNFMMRKLISEYKSWGLGVNINKTVYLCGGAQKKVLAIEDRTTIEYCHIYSYLGIDICNDGVLDKAIKESNTLARKLSMLPNSVIWEKSINKNNKKRYNYKKYKPI